MLQGNIEAPEVCDMLMDSEVLVELLLIEGNVIPVVLTKDINHAFHNLRTSELRNPWRRNKRTP